MSTADTNLAKDLDEIAGVYAIDPDLVLRRRFKRLHHFNLLYKHARLVALDQSVADYESLKQTIGTSSPQPAGVANKSPKIVQLLNDIEDALEDFGGLILYFRFAGDAYADK